MKRFFHGLLLLIITGMLAGCAPIKRKIETAERAKINTVAGMVLVGNELDFIRAGLYTSGAYDFHRHDIRAWGLRELYQGQLTQVLQEQGYKVITPSAEAINQVAQDYADFENTIPLLKRQTWRSDFAELGKKANVDAFVVLVPEHKPDYLRELYGDRKPHIRGLSVYIAGDLKGRIHWSVANLTARLYVFDGHTGAKLVDRWLFEPPTQTLDNAVATDPFLYMSAEHKQVLTHTLRHLLDGPSLGYTVAEALNDPNSKAPNTWRINAVDFESSFAYYGH